MQFISCSVYYVSLVSWRLLFTFLFFLFTAQMTTMNTETAGNHMIRMVSCWPFFLHYIYSFSRQNYINMHFLTSSCWQHLSCHSTWVIIWVLRRIENTAIIRTSDLFTNERFYFMILILKNLEQLARYEHMYLVCKHPPQYFHIVDYMWTFMYIIKSNLKNPTFYIVQTYRYKQIK